MPPAVAQTARYDKVLDTFEDAVPSFKPSLPQTREQPQLAAEHTNAEEQTKVESEATATTSRGPTLLRANVYELYEDRGFQRLFARIDSLSNLRDDWNSYGSVPPNRTARFLARRVLEELSHINLVPSTINPSSEEGVAFFFQLGQKRASIECLNTGEILALFSEPEKPPKVWEITFPEDEGIPAQEHTLRRQARLIQEYLTR